MANIIKHKGTVENIDGSLYRVRIQQTSACASCSAKGYCSSSDSKEKIIEVYDSSNSYKVGEERTSDIKENSHLSIAFCFQRDRIASQIFASSSSCKRSSGY